MGEPVGKRLTLTPTLGETLAMVGAHLGLDREYGETEDAFRERLIASGKVSSIEAGEVRLVGYVKFVSIEIGFSMGETGRRA